MISPLLTVLAFLVGVKIFGLWAMAQVLILIFLFGLTVFVHELGHFLTALATGMKVTVFSIGFGPAIFQKKIRGIKYKIGWFPVGGYVAIPQLDPTGMEAVQGKDDIKMEALPPVASWKRILVSVAGSTGNVLFAILLAWIIYQSPSVITEEGNTTIGAVAAGSQAYEAGIRPGDKVVSLDGEKVRSWSDVSLLAHLAGGKNGYLKLGVQPAGTKDVREVQLETRKSEMKFSEIPGVAKSSLCVVVRVMDNSPAERGGLKKQDIIEAVDGETIYSREHFMDIVANREGKLISVVVLRNSGREELWVKPEYNKELEKPYIGIMHEALFGTPWMQFKKPADQLKGDALPIVRFLKALVTPSEARHAAQGMGGPPMIFVTLWLSMQISLLNAVAFMRFLNINLAIINMLPMPVLDGGHVMFAIWEGITRRKPNPKFVNALVNVFAVLLISLMIFLSLRDLYVLPKWLGRRNPSGESGPSNRVEAVTSAIPASVTNSNAELP
jgi:regulator of sigma E protease